MALGMLFQSNRPPSSRYRGELIAACAIVQGLELSNCDACGTTSAYRNTYIMLSALLSSTDCPLKSQQTAVKIIMSLLELAKQPKPPMKMVELIKAASSLWMEISVRERSTWSTSTAPRGCHLMIARGLLDASCDDAYTCIPCSSIKSTWPYVKPSVLAATTAGELVHTVIAHLRLCLETRGCSAACSENDECRRSVQRGIC